MAKTRWTSLAAAALLAVSGAAAPAARAAGDSALTGPQQDEVRDIIKKYLTENPEILLDMSSELERRRAAAQEEAQTKALADNADKLYRSPLDYVGGNPQGNVTVVEFFDYNCHFCKKALPTMVKLIDKDDHVRLVLKEFPIFGEDSENAAKVVLAAKKQGKYFEMHRDLLGMKGHVDKAKALEVAQKIGLDMDKLKKDMANPEVEQTIQTNMKLAQDLGIDGTPQYFVGDKSIIGAPGNLFQEIEKRVEVIRKDGCDKVSC